MDSTRETQPEQASLSAEGETAHRIEIIEHAEHAEHRPRRRWVQRWRWLPKRFRVRQARLIAAAVNKALGDLFTPEEVSQIGPGVRRAYSVSILSTYYALKATLIFGISAAAASFLVWSLLLGYVGLIQSFNLSVILFGILWCAAETAFIGLETILYRLKLDESQRKFLAEAAVGYIVFSVIFTSLLVPEFRLLWLASFCLTILLSVVFCLALYKVYRSLASFLRARRRPEAALIVPLLQACFLLKNQTLWRQISRRRQIANFIDNAAKAIDGPVSWAFLGRSGGGGESMVRARLRSAAAVLREKLVWLATPKPDTRIQLTLFLHEAILAAATGDLDRLGEPTTALPTLAEADRRRWLMRLARLARWAIFALGPAAFLWLDRALGWNLLSEPAVRAVIVQAAILSFIVASFSELEPAGYKDKLGSVMSAGGSLFGWSRPGGHS